MQHFSKRIFLFHAAFPPWKNSGSLFTLRQQRADDSGMAGDSSLKPVHIDDNRQM
jgi:hypothetical protein